MSGTNRVTAAINRLLAAVSSNRLRLSAVSNRLLAEVKFGLFLLLKQLADEATATQLIEKLFGKALSDSTETLDSPSKEVGKSLADESTASDLASKETGKTLLHEAETTDSETRAIGKVLADSAETSETTAFDTTKALSDIAGVTDDILGAADIDDQQNMHFFKNTTDSARSADSLDRTVALIVNLPTVRRHPMPLLRGLARSFLRLLKPMMFLIER